VANATASPLTACGHGPGLESAGIVGACLKAISGWCTASGWWTIHPHVRVSLADVELPGGTRFTPYVFRMRPCAMTAVLDDQGGRLLMMRWHRFIVDRWVWELPGGYVDDGEDLSGDILGAITVIGAQHVLLAQAGVLVPRP
jgi:hypothetical protein